MIGGYDDIYQPEVTDERYDYFLFCDCFKEEKVGIWNVKKVPYINDDKTRIARYVKTHPHELLPEYDATIWIDANISIISCELYERGIDLLNKDINVAGIKHPFRDCIYDEAFVVLANGLEYERIINKWCHFLRQSEYPRHNGLFESNVLYRRNNQVTNNANDLWWSYINHYSRRDQLSLNFVLTHYDIGQCYLLGNDEHCRNSNNITVRNHKKQAADKGRRGLKATKFEYFKNRLRAGFVNGENHHKALHFWIWSKNQRIAQILMNIWGIYALFFWGIVARYNSHKK